jgi:hypothetical protein
VASARSLAKTTAAPAALPGRYEWLQNRPPQPILSIGYADLRAYHKLPITAVGFFWPAFSSDFGLSKDQFNNFGVGLTLWCLSWPCHKCSSWSGCLACRINSFWTVRGAPVSSSPTGSCAGRYASRYRRRSWPRYRLCGCTSSGSPPGGTACPCAGWQTSALPLSVASLKFSSSASISVSNFCKREVSAAPRSQVFAEPFSRNVGSRESRPYPASYNPFAGSGVG